jgi:hypothetical protein
MPSDLPVESSHLRAGFNVKPTSHHVVEYPAAPHACTTSSERDPTTSSRKRVGIAASFPAVTATSPFANLSLMVVALRVGLYSAPRCQQPQRRVGNAVPRQWVWVPARGAHIISAQSFLATSCGARVAIHYHYT